MSIHLQIQEQFITQLTEVFPGLSPKAILPFVSPELVSPHKVVLPKSVLLQAQAAVLEFHQLRNSPQYLSNLKLKATERGLIDPGNFAICSSFDFHLNSQGQLKLIEVNTNAAFLFLSLALYRLQGLAPDWTVTTQGLKAMILSEMKLHFGEARGPRKIAIVDKDPPNQKLFVEFLAAKTLFESWGWPTEILDHQDLTDDFDFIYNRHTDFFLESAESQVLKKIYLSGAACVSPHPFEYLAMADKERMPEWSLGDSGLGPAARSVLLDCKILSAKNREELWSQRKKYFFKPLRSFGSKQSYKGESISKKAFEALPDGESMAQELVPAPEQQFGDQKFKFDLRFYTYQGQVQSALARLYQGQLTNLKTLGGGFTAIDFR